jgi:hypothetical protein
MSHFNRLMGHEGTTRDPMSDGFGGRTAAFFSSAVETMPFVPSGLPAVEPPQAEKAVGDDDEAGSEPHGFACKQCDRSTKTPHGLARHIHAKHGGYGGLGRSF